MDNIEGNKFFDTAKNRAGEIIDNNSRIRGLIAKTREKIDDIDISSFSSSKFVQRIKVLIKMIKSYKSGDYKNIELQNVLLILAAIIYFVMPIDLIPDFIPITGFIDDFTVVVWVYKKVQTEIDKFIEWEDGYEEADEVEIS